LLYCAATILFYQRLTGFGENILDIKNPGMGQG